MSADMTAARYRAACAALGLPVWRPGMLSTHGARVLADGLWASSSGVIFADENIGEQPDFTDAATIGCLVAAVREAWLDEGVHAKPAYRPADGARWLALPPGGYAHGYGETEADALIAALEAAARARVPRG
jgi:hypothetical protein